MENIKCFPDLTTGERKTHSSCRGSENTVGGREGQKERQTGDSKLNSNYIIKKI